MKKKKDKPIKMLECGHPHWWMLHIYSRKKDKATPSSKLCIHPDHGPYPPIGEKGPKPPRKQGAGR